MSVVVVRPGGLIPFDPSDKRVIVFDWDRSALASTASISSQIFTISAVRQNGVTALTKDNEDILTAAEATIALERTVTADSRVTSVRLLATTATDGDIYDVANKITTNESPSQDIEQSVRILVQNR